MTLKEFNSKYKYQSDKEKFGFFEVWEIPELQEDGFYYGDCESYCRFLKANISEFKDFEYYYCKLNGVGHCVLRSCDSIIDCNTKKEISIELFMQRYSISEFKKYNKFTIFCKCLFATIFIPINKLIKKYKS